MSDPPPIGAQLGPSRGFVLHGNRQPVGRGPGAGGGAAMVSTGASGLCRSGHRSAAAGGSRFALPWPGPVGREAARRRAGADHSGLLPPP